MPAFLLWMKFSVSVVKFSKIMLQIPLCSLSIYKGTYLVAFCFILLKLKIIACSVPKEEREGGTRKWKKKQGKGEREKFAIKGLRTSSFLMFLGLFFGSGFFVCLFNFLSPKTGLAELAVELGKHTQNP